MEEQPKGDKIDKDFSEFQSPHEASVEKLVQALDRAYHHSWLMMWRAFLQGIMSAIGFFVGTLIIGILIAYLFQALGGVSLFEPWVDQYHQITSDK